MTNSNHNSKGEFDDFDSPQNQAMSDARLDALLGLAKPTLDPKRQKLVRQQVVNTLETSRGNKSKGAWSRWVGDRFLGLGLLGSQPTRLKLATSVFGLMLMAWIGWSMLPNDPSTIDVAKNVPNVSDNDSPALDVNEPIANLPIISRVAGTRVKRKRTSHSKPFTSALRFSFQKIETTFLQTASSDFGLRITERLSGQLEESAIDMQTSLAIQSDSRSGRRQVKEIQNQLRRIETAQLRLERYLTDCLSRLPDDQATDAFRLLCRVGSKRALPTILHYWNHQPTKQDAVVAVKRMGDSRLLVRLINDSNELETQAQLMAGLLCRADRSSVDTFLQLTVEQELYPVAQRCGAILGPDCLPTEMLIERLRSNRMTIARAAAITMAEMSDPRITEHLMQLASQPESARSAVMALTARTDPSSVRFVQLAATDARWSATVINEQKKWSRLLAVN